MLELILNEVKVQSYNLEKLLYCLDKMIIEKLSKVTTSSDPKKMQNTIERLLDIHVANNLNLNPRRAKFLLTLLNRMPKYKPSSS